MKRLWIGLMVLVLALSLTGAAFAASVPKTVCLYMVVWGDVLHLNLKNIGTASTTYLGAPAKVKMYAVNGNHHFGSAYSFPTTGTAYVEPGTTTVHMSLTGSFGATLNTVAEEVTWDYTATTNPVGSVNLRYIANTNGSTLTFNLNLIDCATDPIPFNVDNTGPMIDRLQNQ
jgi:hypothetical protein